MNESPDLAPWFARIEALNLFDEVGGPLELAAALAKGEDYGPRCYLTHTADQMRQESAAIGGAALAQEAVATVSVVFLVGQYDAWYTLRALRAAVLNSLGNWWPAGVSRGVRWDGGQRVSDLDAGQLIWRDDYTVGWRVCHPTKQT